jgi:hypothetical protein
MRVQKFFRALLATRSQQQAGSPKAGVRKGFAYRRHALFAWIRAPKTRSAYPGVGARERPNDFS